MLNKIIKSNEIILNFSYLCIVAVIARTVEEEQMDLVTVCFVAEWNERM